MPSAPRVCDLGQRLQRTLAAAGCEAAAAVVEVRIALSRQTRGSRRRGRGVVSVDGQEGEREGVLRVIAVCARGPEVGRPPSALPAVPVLVCPPPKEIDVDCGTGRSHHMYGFNKMWRVWRAATGTSTSHNGERDTETRGNGLALKNIVIDGAGVRCA